MNAAVPLQKRRMSLASTAPYYIRKLQNSAFPAPTDEAVNCLTASYPSL